MNTVCLNDVHWKELLQLDAHQIHALEAALRLAENSKEIQCALESDLVLLKDGIGKIETSEDVLKKLYGEALYQIHPVLVLLMRMPWLVQKYQEHSIPDSVLKDTLSDVKIWMNVCEKKTGVPGLLEYGWLSNHFSFKLFRLGRLQFVYQKGTVPAHVYRHKSSSTVIALCPHDGMYMENGEGAGLNGQSYDGAWRATLQEEDGCIIGFPIHRNGYAIHSPVHLPLDQWELAYKPGDSVLDMHIAEGCPLDPISVKQSLDSAVTFFERHFQITDINAMTCSSWLLDDNIAQLQPNGNIAAFQRFFHLVPHEQSSDWQTRQRIFDNPDIDISKAECRTSLQKAVSAWYAAGKYCRHAAGFILI